MGGDVAEAAEAASAAANRYAFCYYLACYFNCYFNLCCLILPATVHSDRHGGQGHAEAVKLAPTVQAARRTGDPAPTVPAAQTVEAGPSGLAVQASRAVKPPALRPPPGWRSPAASIRAAALASRHSNDGPPKVNKFAQKTVDAAWTAKAAPKVKTVDLRSTVSGRAGADGARSGRLWQTRPQATVERSLQPTKSQGGVAAEVAAEVEVDYR